MEVGGLEKRHPELIERNFSSMFSVFWILVMKGAGYWVLGFAVVCPPGPLWSQLSWRYLGGT